jgi:glycosyltransferase involved in cell wall biosynthesis
VDVSILIPCYNTEKYVARAVESALGQTWPDKEVIVVDDGSTDGSAAILDRFAGRKVRIVHQENRGQSAAANRAFRESSGRYIKFFDADDLMHSELVERQIERLGKSTTAVASAEWGRFYGDDLKSFQLNPQSVWRDMQSLDWLVEAWMDARPMMQCGLWLIPREVLEHSGLWNEQLSLINDFEFFTRVLCHADEVRFTSGAPVYYRSGVFESLSGRKGKAAVDSAYLSMFNAIGHLLARRNHLSARRACANILQQSIYDYYPTNADVCPIVRRQIARLGGSSRIPTGSPKFDALRRLLGWKLAKRLQRSIKWQSCVTLR